MVVADLRHASVAMRSSLAVDSARAAAAPSGSNASPAADRVKIRIQSVSKAFATDAPGTAPVLGELSLDVRENEFVVLLGRSGCGKTTLLNIVAGLEVASSGSVRV